MQVNRDPKACIATSSTTWSEFLSFERYFVTKPEERLKLYCQRGGASTRTFPLLFKARFIVKNPDLGSQLISLSKIWLRINTNQADAMLLLIIIIHCSCFMHCDWSVAYK